MQRLRIATALSAAFLFIGLTAPSAWAMLIAPGYQVTEVADTADASGSVLVIGETVFAGFGGFDGGNQEVVRIDSDGTRTSIANGFNSVAGLAYDATNDRLIIGDNGREFSNAVTGDTVFGIANPFGTTTATAAFGSELLPAGTISSVADITLDPSDSNRLFVTDAATTGGRLWEVDLSAGTALEVQTGLGFAAGLAASATDLFIGDVDSTTFAGLILDVAITTPAEPLNTIASGLGGQFDLDLTADGLLLATAGSEILVVDLSDGSMSSLATGLVFGGGISEDDGTIYFVDFVGGNQLFKLTLVPEPGTASLLALGLCGLALQRRS